jgi:hypothetical protein
MARSYNLLRINGSPAFGAEAEILMTVDRTIKISDLLTSLTILVSVITLTVSWSKDRLTREKEQADRVRSAAAKTLTQLDRWQALQLSIFRELQPVFVETSEMLADNFNVIKVRDYLWKTINIQRTHIASKVLEEQIGTAYVDLLAHFPAVRSVFLNAFTQLKQTETRIMEAFLAGTEGDVLSLNAQQNVYTTAMLGNALRATAVKHSEHLETETNQIIQPVREFLFEIIAKADTEILKVAPKLPPSLKR